MDESKRWRRAARTAFTRAHTAFQATFREGIADADKMVAFQFLEIKMAELNEAHGGYNKALFASEMTDEEIAAEMESDDAYRMNFLNAKLKIDAVGTQTVLQGPNISVVNEKKIKLPSIELPKFNGNVKEWLPFWSQFKKINDDVSIRKEDKFQYLLQTTVPGSKAHDLVNSFPPTGENFDKAIKCLKNRFGREDIVVEYYIRELLGLVMQNALKGGKKPSLSTLYDKLESNIRALDSLGVAADKCAAMLYPLVESSLPEEILRVWQRSDQRGTTETEEPNTKTDRLTKLLEFLQREVENEERIDMALTGFGISAGVERSGKQKNKNETGGEVASANVLFVSKDERLVQCIFCKSSHESGDCEKARKLNLEECKEIIKKENSCFYCLRRGHIAKNCRIRIKCDWCSKRHLLVMCTEIRSRDKVDRRNRENGFESDGKVQVEKALATFAESPAICLQTLRVKIYSSKKEKIVRAVIDTASQRSYLKSDVAKELGYLPVGEKEVIHSLFGGVKSKVGNHKLYLIRLKSLDNSFACNFSVLNQDIICDNISSLKCDRWVDELKDHKIELSDLEGNSGQIDVLIGADVAGKLLTGKKVDLQNGLSAFETLLGWTVMGKINNQVDRVDPTDMVTSMFVRDAGVADLWQLDTLGILDPIEKMGKSLKDEKTLDFLIKTAQVISSGRYEVKLPWVEDHAPLSDNYEISRIRLEKGIQKLKKQNLLLEYDEVFREWEADGIIEEVRARGGGDIAHYLPHRPVLKESGTMKIRPVFDASASEKGYPSLNQCVEKGPNLIELVPTSLNRFREGEIGVVSDIRRAFLQILINKEDRDYLRFLWVRDGKLIEYRHCRVVFGLACSPFLLAAVLSLLLTKVLKQIEDGSFVSSSKESIEKLQNSFYVDNCVTSVNSKNELENFIKESTACMLSGGFDLRGWEYSNDEGNKETTLVLGILWNKKKDTISINPSLLDSIEPTKVTKREILSMTHRCFDPLGITCPVLLLPKLMLRKLWEEKKDWDTEITGEIKTDFLSWIRELPMLCRLEIPRKLDKGKLTIHAFGDASGVAYATVIYARIETEEKVVVRFLSAKARVAPKNATMPRLELMAASITARLVSVIEKSLTRKIEQIFYWSDSTTVLAWLERDIQWGAFVWNRVKEIRALSNQGKWNYVPGDQNPADLPSRGCSPGQILESQWWSGPEWLLKTEEEWPRVTQVKNEEEIRREAKKGTLVQMVNIDRVEFSFGKYFSSYTKIIRFCAWLQRFIKNRKIILQEKRDGKNRDLSKIIYLSEKERKQLSLTYNEIKAAEVILLKRLQEIMFSDTERNKLSSFKTYKNEDDLYVLKTKIFHRKDDLQFLSPVLLDGSNEVVRFLVKEAHERAGHSGAMMTMSNLRERFWITSLRKLIRSIITDCVVCKRQRVKHLECETPPLPYNRVRDAAVFETVGIDFAGPLFIKGGNKGWICIFTCAVYRAIHLELASALSTDEFLECLRRFIARRGRPRLICSDNGTNFVGASNAFNTLNWEKIEKHSSVSQIQWQFNPPSAPWWGGWWERLIGILKTVLRKVLGKACLTYETLVTTLCDAEAIINSRPLTYLSDDPNELKPLTPSIFLQDIPEIGTPDCDILDHKKLNEKVQLRKKVRDDLRKRFRNEYLSQLILKKGKKEKRIVNVGDIVLVGDDCHKRINWPLARIMNKIPGKDGKERVFILKTKDGIIKRPVQRIYPLEIAQGDFSADLRDMVQSERDANIVKSKRSDQSERAANVVKLRRSDQNERFMNFGKLRENNQDTHVNKEQILLEPIVTRKRRIVKKPDFFKF